VATTEVYETRAYPAGLIWTSTTVTGETLNSKP